MIVYFYSPWRWVGLPVFGNPRIVFLAAVPAKEDRDGLKAETIGLQGPYNCPFPSKAYRIGTNARSGGVGAFVLVAQHYALPS